MKKRKTSILSVLTSVFMIIVSLGIVVGYDMFQYDFSNYDQFQTVSYWTQFGLLTISVLLFFFAVVRLTFEKREVNDDNYHLKIDNINEVVNTTGLIDCDDFLDEYYLDKKEKKLIEIYRARKDKIMNKADRKGFNLKVDDIPDVITHRHTIKWKKPLNIFKACKQRKYVKLKKKHDKNEIKLNDPDIRKKAEFKNMPQVYRVSRALISDGLENTNKGDSDKPVSGASYMVKTAGTKVMFSVAMTFLLASMIIDQFDGSKFGTSAFLIFLGIRLLVFGMNVYTGIMQGNSYFEDVILGLAVIRENMLTKYLTWIDKRKTNKTKEVKVIEKQKDDNKKGVESDETN